MEEEEEKEEKEEEEGCEEEGGCYSCIVSGGIASSYPQVLTFTTPNIFQVYSLHFSKSTHSHLLASLSFLLNVITNDMHLSNLVAG